MPTESPDPIARGYEFGRTKSVLLDEFDKAVDELTKVRLLMAKVQILRKPLMINPPKMHLISDMPDPAA